MRGLEAEVERLKVRVERLEKRGRVLDEALTLAVLAQVGIEASVKPGLVESYSDFRKLVTERKQTYISIAESDPDALEGENMGKTSIEWTEYSWNPVTGCTPISPGCQNCYAKRIAHRLSQNPTVPHRERYEGFRVSCWPERLEEPLHWRKPRMVFVSSMGDLFHENVSFEVIDQVFAVAALCPQHTFLMLTKRPEQMAAYLSAGHELLWRRWSKAAVEMDIDAALWIPTFRGVDPPQWPLPNVWLGVTIENQDTADERVPILLQTRAAKRFVSVEPMLGPIVCGDVKGNVYRPWLTTAFMAHPTRLDWVICGGESGPGARPMHPDWVRNLRDQCVAAGVPFMFKQWGEWGVVDSLFGNVSAMHAGQLIGRIHDDELAYYAYPSTSEAIGLIEVIRKVGRKRAGRLLDGELWDQRLEVIPCEHAD